MHSTPTRLARYTRWLPLIFALLTTAYEGNRLLNSPLEYRARAKFVGTKWTFREETLNSTHLDPANIQRKLQTELEIIKSERLAERTIQKVKSLHPNLDPIPVILEGKVMKGSTILLISTQGAEPNYVTQYLDAILDEYSVLRIEMLETALVKLPINTIIIEQVLIHKKTSRLARDQWDDFLSTFPSINFLKKESLRLAEKISALHKLGTEHIDLTEAVPDSLTKELHETEAQLEDIKQKLLKHETLLKATLEAKRELNLWENKLTELRSHHIGDGVAIMERPALAIKKAKPYLRNLTIAAIIGVITGLLIHLPLRWHEQRRLRPLAI